MRLRYVSRFILAGMLTLGLIAAGCAPTAAPASTPTPVPSAPASAPIVLRAFNVTNKEHVYNILALKMADVLEQKSGGRLKMEVNNGTQFGGEIEILQQLQSGTIDMYIGSTIATSNVIPEAGVLDLPFLFGDRDQLYKVLNGPIGEKIKEKYAAKNLKVLTFADLGFRNMVHRSKFTVAPEDLKGQKIRAIEAPISRATLQALGASPTPMGIQDVYQSLQNGVLDGMDQPVSGIPQWKLPEVAPYITQLYHQVTAFSAIVRMDTWNKLPADLQKLLLDASAEGQKAAIDEMNTSEARFWQEVAQMGGKVKEYKDVDIAAYRSRVAPVYQQFFGEGEKAALLKSVQDALK